ncbi:transporter [Mycena epipterygia]|nr:transporter [Mycena epipterygia]
MSAQIADTPRGSSDPTIHEPPVPEPSRILTGKKLAAVFTAILFSVLIIALDQTILATALPRIASDFSSFSLQGWVASSFLLAQTAFLLFYGQLFRIVPSKWILVGAVTIFEVGSLVCGVAQNVEQLIAGRTVSGLGAAGIFVASIQIISESVRLEDRARLFGLFGAVFGLSSVIGPLVGGAFTDHAAPPLGSDPSKRSYKELFKQVRRLDFVGIILVAGAVTCISLALEWGGNTKPWGDKGVIICFVFSAVIAGAWIRWEIYLGDSAMVPMAIFKSHSVFLTRFSLLLFSYYIPIFYQAARHRSATASGIDLLPFVLSVVLSGIISGQVVGKFGYYWPLLFVAPMFLGVGSGLLYTLNTNSSSASLVGFQILAGVGTGLGMQNSLLAMQVEFRNNPKLLGQATSMAGFGQFLGGTLGLGVAEPVFSSELTKFLLKYAPDAPVEIVRQSPTAIYTALPAAMIPGVVQSYLQSLRIVFVLGAPVAGLALLSAFFIKNIRIVRTEQSSAAKVDAEKAPET